MDAHYDQVMNARSEAEGAAERVYFAYSTILDRAAFEEWRHQHGYDFFELPPGEPAEALDVALDYDFPSRWWGGRVAGLADRQGHSVHGLLFRIPGKDWPIIQHKEGLVTKMCVERTVRVRAGGRELEATAFTTAANRQSKEGHISSRFVDALVRGATAAGLPASWVASLRQSDTR
jgi:gamma-glutamylcyclotransferase